jgi:hypothetical protein
MGGVGGRARVRVQASALQQLQADVERQASTAAAAAAARERADADAAALRADHTRVTAELAQVRTEAGETRVRLLHEMGALQRLVKLYEDEVAESRARATDADRACLPIARAHCRDGPTLPVRNPQSW